VVGRGLMRYLSVCSGIEAATVAWHPLGWKPAAFAEIDKFPRAVLQHHYPDVPIHGDFTTIGANDYGTVDLLVGGTPCQSFSVAGLRGGLDDDRGNLALEFMRLAARIKPTWIVWENVPGVLSSNGGRDFGSILGALGELGYGWAYRVLDAQHFGVPQRRRRVFVVGCTRGWQCAAAVLFERHSVSGNPPPRKEKRETAPIVPARRTAGGGLGTDFDCDGGLIARCDTAGEGKRFDSETTTLVAFDWQTGGDMRGLDPKPTAQLQRCQVAAVCCAAVRRLTPRECERLQGFPDDYTAIPWRGKPADQCPDGPRYKALGNSMAVPVMAWIGQRIAAVTDTSKLQDALRSASVQLVLLAVPRVVVPLRPRRKRRRRGVGVVQLWLLAVAA
jgi:DNA (cytosine-5)-methyltransferase 1